MSKAPMKRDQLPESPSLYESRWCRGMIALTVSSHWGKVSTSIERGEPI